jgi:xylulose-5-phosphate/fructose-6-phosphate phosphoketolase
VICNKSPEVVRIYLPPDANCLLSTMNHCFRSQNYVNVVVADKQNHLQYLNMEDAITHCTKGIGIWQWASNDSGSEPDVVFASCGDVVTQEALAGVALLREHLPDVKVRFVNVVDLFKLIQQSDHPHGLSDVEFRSLFTDDKPVIFNFHSYPWLVHRLTYGRKASHNMHVCGYREKGNIDTPVELAIRNGVDRFSLAMAAIDRMPGLGNKGSTVRENLLDAQIKARNTSFFEGVDPKEITDWKWPL